MSYKQRCEKWTNDIEVIYIDVANLVTRRHCFKNLQDIIQQNPRIKRPSSFWTFCDQTYIAYSMMACRRQIKSQGSSISLIGLLDEIKATPELMSRKHFVNLYPENIQDEAHCIFDKYFTGTIQKHIDPTIIQRDLCELRSYGGNTGNIERTADRIFAHLDRSESRKVNSASIMPTFNELDNCIDTLEKLTRKYRLLITACDSGESMVVTSVNDYSEEIFRQPWIL